MRDTTSCAIFVSISRRCWQREARAILSSFRLAARPKRDLPKGELPFLDTGRFALETHHGRDCRVGLLVAALRCPKSAINWSSA